ncbi:MAG TPA: SsrA-binding protein SmpB [Candidatus Dojkabacteria bacterium]|jgi:SsrA-binding protein
MKVLASNKKAYYDFEIVDKYEAGIVLEGWEVKSIREGNISLKESFVFVKKNEMWLIGAHIARWTTQSSHKTYDPIRERKLLLSKQEIHKIVQRTSQKGYTVIPLKVYSTSQKRIKIEIGIAKGKKEFEKKQVKVEKTQKLDLQRQIRGLVDKSW